MSSRVIHSFASILGFFESHSRSLIYTITSLITTFGETFISDYLFRCPCMRTDETTIRDYLEQTTTLWKKVYSVVFMTVPAVALLCLSLAVNNDAHRCLSIKFRRGDLCRSVKFFMSTAASGAVVAPCAWILLVFLDGRYLECGMSRIPTPCVALAHQLPQNDTIREYVAGVRADNLYYQTLSQVIAWAILGTDVLVMTLVMLTKPCHLDSPYYQQQFMSSFRKKEMESFHKASEDVLSRELGKKWQLFFDEASEGDWQAISDLPYGDPSVEKDKFFYSAFHKWRRDNKDAESMSSRPYAGFVSGRPLSETRQDNPSMGDIEMGILNNGENNIKI